MVLKNSITKKTYQSKLLFRKTSSSLELQQRSVARAEFVEGNIAIKNDCRKVAPRQSRHALKETSRRGESPGTWSKEKD